VTLVHLDLARARNSLLPAATALLALIAAPAAGAAVSDSHTVAGPSADVVDLGGVAMAEDGTGGLVYWRRAGGRAHVYAAQFRDGRWRPPQRVDVGQRFDSYWPRIGAGDDGRLVVTWVQEFGPGSDRMFSASLDPGATSFQGPIPIDFDVGEATATYPSLAMNRGGSAYLAYRVITDTSSANPPGYVGAETRLARYGGSLWTPMGSVDRNPSIPVRTPNFANSPKVGIDITGGGLIAFHEPGNDFVDRVWARRLFGSSVGIPLAVSPQSWGGAPLRGSADAFSLDVSGFGQGAIAFRQQPGEGGRLGGTRVMVNEIPDQYSEGAARFGGPRLADGGARAALGPPSVAVAPLGPFLAAFGSRSATLSTTGDTEVVDPVERLDDGSSVAAPEPVVDLADSGATVAAWRQSSGGRGSVAVREGRADGVPELATSSGRAGGAVGQLLLGGSGLGDAIVAFHQGGAAFGQIVATVVDAPPASFFIQVPDGWQRRRRTRINWDPSPSSISPVTYTVAVDDEPVRERLRRLTTVLGRDDLENGVHEVQVIAIDAAGQETGSQVGTVRIDRSRPRVRLRLRGRRLAVRIRDRGGSGVRRSRVRISFGDGRRSRRRVRARHVYRRAGVFRVVIRARDRAGNRLTFKRRLRVR
jgi:hypothetical protein